MNTRKISKRTAIISIAGLAVLLAGIAVCSNFSAIKSIFDRNVYAVKQETENQYNEHEENKEPVADTEQYTKAASGNYDIVFGLDSWIGGTPVIYGMEKGIDKKYSLNIGIESLNNEKTKMLGLKEGKFQAVEIALPVFLSMQKEYPRCGVIAGITDFSFGADGLIVESEISDLSQLKGKSIAYLDDDFSKYSMYQFLKKANLKYTDIKAVEHTMFQSMMEDINTGKVDGVVASNQALFTILNYVNGKEQNALKLILSSRDIPDFMPTVLVFNNAFAQDYPDKAEAFLKMWFDSAGGIMKDSDKSYMDILEVSKKYPEIYGDVNENDVKQSLSGIKLMSLNGNFDYFGIDGKDIKLEAIIKETSGFIQDSKGAPGETDTSNILSGAFLESIFKGQQASQK